MKFNTIIIGGGPSGMMAAIAAAQHQKHVLLIEKNKRLGKKMLMTGGGRCNVTNAVPVEELINHIPGNGKFLYSTFAQFNNYDIIDFFTSRNICLKEEDHGRMFPCTDKSKTIVDTLIDELNRLNVTIWYQSEVSQLWIEQHQLKGVRLTDNQYIKCQNVIITTGGKTYPHTGSTGAGYHLAKQAGHTITPLYPTESPLCSQETFIKEKQLQGLSLQNIKLSVIDQSHKVHSEQYLDLLFTHFGLSGPAALRSSMFVQQLLKKQETVTVLLDVLPHQTKEQCIQYLLTQKQNQPKKSIKNALKGYLPERYLIFLLIQSNIDTALPINQVSQEQLYNLANHIKAFPIQISNTWPLERSFVTGGGVALKEINPKTLESKLLQGLFFAGEVLDINGYTGGYNITAALATGYVAGTHSND